MSVHIPFEIQVEIIKRLPTKSLIRFRSVSKPWKSLIESSEFIAGYHVHNSQPKRLLVSYKEEVDSERKFVSIDDDTFPQRKCSLNVPMFIREPIILGSSRGLFCLFGDYHGEDDSFHNHKFRIVVLWNPSIRKSVVIELHYIPFYETIVGFGVCPNSNDPKIVTINSNIHRWTSMSCIPMQVQVFTLRSKVWRIPSRNLPRKSIVFERCSSCNMVMDGFIYWIVRDRTDLGDEYEPHNLIVSFDLTSEEFREIHLPDSLAQLSWYNLSISNLRDSLVVLDYYVNYDVGALCGVWMMEHGAPNSFTKLFTVDAPNASLTARVVGFRENGESILAMLKNSSAALVVSERSSKSVKDLEFCGRFYSFFVSYYMETLTLLDQ